MEHAGRTKVELKVKGWTKNRPGGCNLASKRPQKALVGLSMVKTISNKGRRKTGLKQYISQKPCKGICPAWRDPASILITGAGKDYLKVKAKRGESLLPGAPLFVSRNSARISPRQAQRDFKVWIKESGIESNLSPHSLRHTVGTRLLKTFKNPKLVQRYLGHSDVATTLRYYVDSLSRHRRGVSRRFRRGGRGAGREMMGKRCPILMVTKAGEKKCLREDCAWWDAHYNCCAILSSAILLDAIAKRKNVQPKTH